MLLLIYGHESENFYRVRVCVCARMSQEVAQELQQPPVVVLILLVTMLSLLLGS